MDIGTVKTIEVVVIGALLVGSYLHQQKSVTRTRSDDTEARQGDQGSEPGRDDD